MWPRFLHPQAHIGWLDRERQTMMSAHIWKLEGEVRTLFVLAIRFWLVKPMLEPYLGSLPYANLALATAAGRALLLLPLVWGRKAEVGPT
jgi:hypothetical protein